MVLLQTWWFELFLPRLGLRRLASRGRIRRLKNDAKRFRNLAAELGGLMIKVGQFMSSRLDVLPVAITRELEGLQDEVAPEPFTAIVEQVEAQLGMKLVDAFETFENSPLAAASLGQVHAARLSPQLSVDYGHAEVVVKVLRPGIQEIVEVDLAALRKVAGWLSRIKLVSRRADAPALIEEFAQTSYEEIDYLNEAQNLEQFKTNFGIDPYVYAPRVIWDRSSRLVLTLENVAAIKVSDVTGLRAAGIDPNAVAAELARTTFEQLFVHGVFHADPHPGNIFVEPTPEAETPFRLNFIDFGMMGRISDEQRQNLQRFLFAVVTRDAQGWVAAVERLDLLLPSADTLQLEQAVDALFKRFGGVGVAELVNTDPREIRDFALQFGELIRTLPFQVPENFLLLARTISIVSGVTSSLNRDFNMWDALDPFARTLLQGGANSTIATFGREALDSLMTLLRLPKRLDNLSSRLERGEISLRNPVLESRVRKLERSQNGQVLAIYFVALFGGGIFLTTQSSPYGGYVLAASAVPLIVSLITRKLP
jgi:predicted unusual protein kinase regulating ubiquinone biosynthesis (AarF/ABC1/UbiB family)